MEPGRDRNKTGSNLAPERAGRRNILPPYMPVKPGFGACYPVYGGVNLKEFKNYSPAFSQERDSGF